MKFDHIFRFSLCSLATVFLISCESVRQDDPDDGPDKVKDIEVIDGKVRFHISIDESAPRLKMGVKPRLTKINVNGREYTPELAEDGSLSVVVDASIAGEYNAVYVNSLSKNWYGTSPTSNVKLPYSQFLGSEAALLADYPMYASYSRETGDKLVFRDAFAVLDIALSGSASVTSVNVKNPSGTTLAGFASYKPSVGRFTMGTGVPFANLNCTAGSGSAALDAAAARHFYLVLAPGNYRNGLDLTICDTDHRMMELHTGELSLDANSLHSIPAVYEPESDLVWYEGFNNFVWGGDYVGGESVPAFAPTADAVTIDSSSELSGYEYAFEQVAYDSPGTGYVQSNTWDECNSTATLRRTVASSHRLSESWVKSRAVGDFVNLFRCQERPGYVEVGAASTTRGIVKTGRPAGLKGLIDGSCSFDICLKADFNDSIEILLEEGGRITGCSINGRELDLSQELYSCKYASYASRLVIPASALTRAGSAAAAKTWDHVELTIEGYGSGTALYLTSLSSSSGHHGFYVDNITFRRSADVERGPVRVLSWNIQNGMWADQANNYDDFVRFVKKYDPDICIWCEASSIYKNGTTESAPKEERFLPDGWASLAARYGHGYTAIGGFRDNFPQVVTSRYPITTLKKITDTDVSGKPVAHGAGLHSISVKGREIYVATLHTWPQSYGYGVKTADREASSANHEGDYQRQHEMQYVVNNTRNAPEYSSHVDWIFAGDFNSRSRRDNWYYGYDGNSTLLLTQDVILEQTDYVDIVADAYGSGFVTSTQGNSRIDYVYMTPSLAKDVVSTRMLMDAWTIAYKVGTTGFYYPSDHRPILVDLQY